MVRPVRFELTTFCSGGKRSIQTELRAPYGHYSPGQPDRERYGWVGLAVLA